MRAVMLACIVPALASSPATAAGLGQVTQQSALGQSLRLVIPVILGAGEELPAECFKLASAAGDADGIPQILFGRVVVERTAAGTQLVVSNSRSVNDPVVKLTLQAGCDVVVRREYTLLMDPPAIEPALAAADSTARTGVVAPRPPVARQPARPARGAARDGARGASAARPTARTPATARSPAAAQGSARAPGTAATQASRKAVPPKPRTLARVAPKAPSAAAAERPRLQVSSAVPAAKGARGATEAEQAKAQQDLANAIEAETFILRQRIVELTAMVDRMQREVEANEVAQRAADEAAKSLPAAPPQPAATGALPPATTTAAETTPPAAPSAATSPPTAPLPPIKAPPAAKAVSTATSSVWWEDNTTFLALIVGLGLLIAGFLLLKRRRDAASAEQWRAPGAAGPRTETRGGPRTETGRGPRSVTALRNAPAGVSPAATVTAPIPRENLADSTESATPLAVSELSQVIEEAGVYVELGQSERAIEVLSKHIRQNPRATPAAWVMLLDLHHANGDRQDFRRLSEEFHEHFNVQTPMWEGFGTSEVGVDNGLDAFPHITKEIVGLWRKPGCHEYLAHLLYDNREGRRIGFPLAAYGDILLLLQVLHAAPVIDIESDLAFDAQTARSAAPSTSSILAAAEKAVARRPMPPESSVRPPQQPIEFELEFNPENDKGNPRKPPT